MSNLVWAICKSFFSAELGAAPKSAVGLSDSIRTKKIRLMRAISWKCNDYFLFIEAEVYEVIILHNILLGLQSLFARALGLGFAASSNEIFKPNDLRTDEALLKVRVN